MGIVCVSLTSGDGPCLLVGMTVYDLFQLIGILSLAFYTLFVRSQFLRIQEVGGREGGREAGREESLLMAKHKQHSLMHTQPNTVNGECRNTPHKNGPQHTKNQLTV